MTSTASCGVLSGALRVHLCRAGLRLGGAQIAQFAKYANKPCPHKPPPRVAPDARFKVWSGCVTIVSFCTEDVDKLVGQAGRAEGDTEQQEGVIVPVGAQPVARRLGPQPEVDERRQPIADGGGGDGAAEAKDHLDLMRQQPEEQRRTDDAHRLDDSPPRGAVALLGVE
eukprot:3446182-Prymnesium_polylepis.4